jgi:FkbM family methyltransferase
LLEQETWFEKELNFLSWWLKPGMTVIDVGANLGVYSLPMARLVGSQGRVYAYEPGSEARGLLEQSRDINSANNLEIFNLALSDGEREGRLILGSSSELNALGDTGEGEAVHITSLDNEDATRGWISPDFIKIDAEGEEERILTGGQNFFLRHSPLVMFEIKAADKINMNLCAVFPAMGYRLFRLLNGAPILVPFDPNGPLDAYELNLFAAKPARVQSLRDENLLVDSIPTWEPTMETTDSLSFLRGQAFAWMFGDKLRDPGQLDPHYAKTLAAYATWRSDKLPAHVRYAALVYAYRTLAALCNRAPTTARYSTFARLAWEGGWRGESVLALNQMSTYIQHNSFQPIEPCWPPSPRFDNIAVDKNPSLWFATAVAEQLERSRSFSTCFGGVSPIVTWLCEQAGALPEMHRRKALTAARASMNPAIPDLLRTETPNHLNAAIWASGKLPGMRVAR